jgi:hypothetical protein
MKKLVVLKLLQMLEWCTRRDDGMRRCPICYEGEKYGHGISCLLAHVMKDLGGEVKIQDN